MLVANVIHNEPWKETKFGVFTTGLIMAGVMGLTSYAMYVYANIIHSPH